MGFRLCWALLLWAAAFPSIAEQQCDPTAAHQLPVGRFGVDHDGTLTDRATGLTWMRCAEGQEWTGATCREGKAWFVMHSWDDAMELPQSSKLQRFGYDDWRLPTRNELLTLVEPACSNPATNLELFPGTPSLPFWTATSTGGGDAYAWRVDFVDGSLQSELKLTSSYMVRLVRGTFTPLPRRVVEQVAVVRPFDDGIHDPDLAALDVLQRPATALAPFPRTGSGSVDWNAALNYGLIEPRTTVDGDDGPMMGFDLNIVMPQTKEMPFVTFPHAKHTEWLECSNCHPAIFVPQLDANPISMNRIMAGEFCGVCHGKVAFSIYECERCHDVMHKGAPERWW